MNTPEQRLLTEVWTAVFGADPRLHIDNAGTDDVCVTILESYCGLRLERGPLITHTPGGAPIPTWNLWGGDPRGRIDDTRVLFQTACPLQEAISRCVTKESEVRLVMALHTAAQAADVTATLVELGAPLAYDATNDLDLTNVDPAATFGGDWPATFGDLPPAPVAHRYLLEDEAGVDQRQEHFDHESNAVYDDVRERYSGEVILDDGGDGDDFGHGGGCAGHDDVDPGLDGVTGETPDDDWDDVIAGEVPLPGDSLARLDADEAEDGHVPGDDDVPFTLDPFDDGGGFDD